MQVIPLAIASYNTTIPETSFANICETRAHRLAAELAALLAGGPRAIVTRLSGIFVAFENISLLAVASGKLSTTTELSLNLVAPASRGVTALILRENWARELC
jgi:hypothetical protein